MGVATFWEGVLAGYGIAIPVGAIAILIIETALLRGLVPGLMAAGGAASADLVYAILAALAGAVLAILLAPYALALRLLSAAVLLALGGYGLWRLRRSQAKIEGPERQPVHGLLATYGKFLGLTLLNPLTIAYFAALILGGSVDGLDTTSGKLAFVLGAFLASLSWQVFLAGIGALGHRYFTARFRHLTSLVGNLIVILFGLRILVELLTSPG